MAQVALASNVSEDRSVNVVAVRGEIDGSNAAHLCEDLAALPGEVLVLDLSDLTFIDGAGLSALLAVHRRRQRIGGSVRLNGLSAFVERILEITKLGNELRVETG